jgi:putative FmdB family regulatory protein
MPTYEYRCKDCGHTFDAYQSFTDDALTECPECTGALKKLFGNVGISFKGSGFYKTDSRSGSSTASPSSTSTSTSSSDGNGSGSTSSGSSDSSGSGSSTPSSSGSGTTSTPAPSTSST